jgi:tRNA pseudouridine55 synthase
MKKKHHFHRDVEGIFLLDKPIGISANAALQQIKRIFAAEKAGHTGSLDPLASGMLPICFGEATKFSQFLLNSDKRYWVIAQLGVKTNTGDAEGEVIENNPVENFSEQKLNAVLEKFRGDIMQVPSMFSALKHQGRPLYEYARNGITIEREARPVTIYELTLIERTAQTLTFDISCSKGTYIRTLVEDIGDALGCGAHVAALRRLNAGPYQESQMMTIEALEKFQQTGEYSMLDQYLLPVDSAISDWPSVTISDPALYYLRRGQPVIISNAPTSGWIRLISSQKKFLGVGEILDDGRVAPRRLVKGL